MTEFIAFFSDFTLRNVALGAALLGITSGILGSFTLLRQQSLLGDALSHAALPGVALGFIISGSRSLLPIMIGALISAAAAAILMTLIINRSRLKTDAALGIVLSTFFAFGLVLLTYIGHQNNAGQAGLNTFLFGQAASILPSDVWVMFAVTLISILLLSVFWKEFKIVTFDRDFAASLGFNVLGLELTMTIMIALAIVIGLQMVGVVLMASMLIAPAAAARQWVKTLEHMILVSALFGALSGLIGALISATSTGLATGPLIVIAASIIVFISLLFAPKRGLLKEALNRRKNNKQLRQDHILLALYNLAKEHNDPEYKSEIGMIKSFYHHDPSKLLKDLESQGLVHTVEHMKEEGKHWVLSNKGYQDAEQIWQDIGGSQ